MAERKEREKSFTTGKFRVSYPHVFKPQAPKEGDKPKYAVTMLIDKKATDKDGKPIIDQIKKALFQAVVRVHGPREKWPKKFQWPVNDGDDAAYSDKEGYKGHYIVKASCVAEYSKPGVFGKERDDNGKWVPIEDANEFYPGCYARASVFPNVWEYMGKTGVSLILNSVQKLGDGKPFTSKPSAEQAFDNLMDDENTEDFSSNNGDEEQESMDFT